MASPSEADADSQSTQGKVTLRAAKNTVILVALRLLIPAFSFALVITLSRTLGAEGLGLYTLAFSYLTLFSSLGPLGLGAVIVRDGAGKPSELAMMLPNAIAIGAGASILLTLGMGALGTILDYDQATRSALNLLSFAILPSTILILFDRAFIALERPLYIAFALIIEHLVKVGGGVVLLFLDFGLESVLIAAILGKFLACIVSFYYLNRAGVNLRPTIQRKTIKHLSSLAPTFSLITIFAKLYWRIDVIMLSKLRPIAEVGQYGAAYRIFDFGIIFPQSLCLSLYPQIATAIKEDEKKLSWLVGVASKYLFAVTLPVAACATVVSEGILTLIYGDGFKAASLTLSILIWTIVPYSFVRLNAYVLISAGFQKIDLRLNVIMSIINVCLNFLLIPLYGHTGAAVATLISMCILFLSQSIYLRKHLSDSMGILNPNPIVILGSISAALFSALFGETNLFVVIFSTPFLYFMILFFGGFFSENELELLRINNFLKKLRIKRKLG